MRAHVMNAAPMIRQMRTMGPGRLVEIGRIDGKDSATDRAVAARPFRKDGAQQCGFQIILCAHAGSGARSLPEMQVGYARLPKVTLRC